MKTQASPMLNRILPLVALLAIATPAHAIWPFSKSEEELQAEAANHVAELLREPKRIIAKAQIAVEDNDLDKAIKYYREAIEAFAKIEATEDTRGAVFSELRFKKVHCISMLDALTLKRAEVMDARQAVSDTSDLEARLAQERAELQKEKQKKHAASTKGKPVEEKTNQQLLVEEEAALSATKNKLAQVKETIAAAQKAYTASEDHFTQVAKQHAAADADVFVARRTYHRLTQNDDAEDDAIEAAEVALKKAEEVAANVKKALDEATQRRASAEEALIIAESSQHGLHANIKFLQENVNKRKEIVAKEEEERRLVEEEARKANEAEILLKKQKEAEETARQLKAQEAARIKADELAQAEAKKDKQRLALELELCESLWTNKDIDNLERRLMENCERWPNCSEFLLYMARIRLLQNRLDDALDLTAIIPAEGKTGMHARLVGAAVYLKKNRPEEAKKVLEQTMKDSPTAPEPYFNMAITLLRMPRLDPKRDIAAQYYIRSVELGGKRSALLERRLNMEEKSAEK